MLCLAQSSEAWETGEIVPFYQETENNYDDNPISTFLINWYQKQNSKVTISKCPFNISCSHFAKKSIDKFGFYIGLCYFFDRFFFRENISIYKNYPFIKNEFNILKVNDNFYLNENLKY